MRPLLTTGLAVIAATALSSTQMPLVRAGTIALPHVEGRIDHLAFDGAGRRLFVAALGNNTVEVIDLRTGRDVKSLPGFREPQGIAVAAGAKQVAVANGQGEGLQLIGAADLRFGPTVRLGDDADNVRYDAGARRLYVGYGDGALAALDADGRMLGEVKLPGHPESFQLEAPGSRIFVNVPAANQIVVIDRATMKVVATWQVAGARANYPMALDDAHHRLFVGCRQPAKVLVYDTTTGRLLDSLAVVGDTDDLFYDRVRNRLYVSGGEGFIDVFGQQGGADRLSRIGRVATAPGARTSLFVPELGRLYLAVPHRGRQQAEIQVYAVR
jgi:DNA-binding beta-propeller fold protein YncE